jgi:hypothetical protein
MAGIGKTGFSGFGRDQEFKQIRIAEDCLAFVVFDSKSDDSEIKRLG